MIRFQLQGDKMTNELQKILDILDSRYPNTMVTDRMDEFERIKLAGKIELIKEIKYLIDKNDDK